MPEVQKAEHGAHVRLPNEVALLEKHVDYFKSCGDEVKAAAFTEELKHTKDGLAHALKAKDLVDQLGLSHEITKTTITYNDALRFVAKTLHETQHGETESTFTRAHKHLKDVKGTRLDGDGKVVDPNESHVDPQLLASPRDPAAEVIEHLGLTDAKHVAAAKALFGKVE